MPILFGLLDSTYTLKYHFAYAALPPLQMV